MEEKATNKCSISDKPLIDPSDDRLGFSKFAEQFANAIKLVDEDECLVYALCGAWGSGKTTCLNFVKSFLEKNKSENDTISVIDFNPWWYSGKKDLLTQFFREFGLALCQNKDNSEVVKKLELYVEVITAIPEPTGILKFLSKLWGLFNKRSKEKKITEIRKDLICKLRQSELKFIIFIDDIDRLDGEEIRDIFKIIKAVGDFPNVIYVLAFDRDVVVESLRHVQPGMPGENYLEKIVQVSFDLPKSNKSILTSFFEMEIEPLLKDTPSELREKKHWQETYLFGIIEYLKTPRNVRRLVNLIKLTYPSLSDKVNFTDFVALQVLKLFEFEIYEFIQIHYEMFVGHGNDPYKRLEPFHETWIKDVPDKKREFIKRFLSHLFPKLKSVWANTTYGVNWIEEWRKKRRICDPDSFPTYFNLTLSGSQMTDKEIAGLVDLSNNEELFAKQVEGLGLVDRGLGDGTTRLKTFLNLLPDHIEKIPKENYLIILRVFFNIGDRLILPQDEGKGLISWGNSRAILRIIILLMEKISAKNKKYEILKESMISGEALYMQCNAIFAILEEKESEETDEELSFSEQQIEELKQALLANIRKYKHLIFTGKVHKPLFILECWDKLAGRDEILESSKKAVNDMNYAEFIKNMYNFIWIEKSTQYVNESIIEEHPKINTKFIEKYFDKIKLFDIAEKAKQHYSEYKRSKESIVIDLLLKWQRKINNNEEVPERFGIDEER